MAELDDNLEDEIRRQVKEQFDRAAGIAGDVVAAWHGHTERMTQAVYGRVTDDRLTAASAVFAPPAIGQS